MAKKQNKCWRCGYEFPNEWMRTEWERRGRVNTFRIKCPGLVESEASYHEVKCGAINEVEVAFKVDFKLSKPK